MMRLWNAICTLALAGVEDKWLQNNYCGGFRELQ